MKIYLYIFLFISFSLLGCQEREKLKTNLDKEVVIQDQKPFIGELSNITFKDRNHFVTYDNRLNLQEFDNFNPVGLIGKKGKGPCEHGAVNNFTVYHDSLFVLDGGQGKYLKYNISKKSDDHCFEIKDDKVQQFSSIQVFDDKSFFVRGSLVKSLEASTPIIYTFNKKSKEIVPTNVILEDLDIPLTGMPLHISLASDKRKGRLLFYLPLTRKVFVYDTKTKSLQEIPVNIYIANDQNIHETEDFKKFGKLLQNKIEVVFDLFALDQGVALGYRKGTGKDQIWGLKIFTYKGKKISEKKFDDRVVYMDQEGTLMTLNLNTERQQNPYSLKVYDYSL